MQLFRHEPKWDNYHENVFTELSYEQITAAACNEGIIEESELKN